jgi:hypothetical protein
VGGCIHGHKIKSSVVATNNHGCIHPVFPVCIMDATTVLGSKCVQLDLAVPGAQAVDPTYIFGCEVEML